MIRPDDLRKMVIGYASQTGIARPIPRPRSGVQNKSDPSESGRKSQRLLITWIGDDPSLYTIVRKYISLEDFTEELYRKVAEKMFAELDNGQFQPAGIISMFEDEEEQRQAAELFHTTLPELSTKQERERAFHDIWCQSNATATSTTWRSWVQMSTRSKKRWKAKKHWKNYKEPAFLWNNRVCGSGQL